MTLSKNCCASVTPPLVSSQKRKSPSARPRSLARSAEVERRALDKAGARLVWNCPGHLSFTSESPEKSHGTSASRTRMRTPSLHLMQVALRRAGRPHDDSLDQGRNSIGDT